MTGHRAVLARLPNPAEAWANQRPIVMPEVCLWHDVPFVQVYLCGS
jgi:hypothetical protein